MSVVAFDDDMHGRLYSWCSVALVHADRMGESFSDFLQADAEHQFYVQWVEDGRPEEWKETAMEYTHRLTYGRLWRLTADIQAFINAAAQVAKCVRTIGGADFPDPPAGASIRDVRNLEEHWEAPSERTIKRVKGDIQSDVKPGQIHYTGEMLWVGNLSMFDLVEWVRRVQEQAAQLLRDAGGDPPTSRHHVRRARPARLRGDEESSVPGSGEPENER